MREIINEINLFIKSLVKRMFLHYYLALILFWIWFQWNIENVESDVVLTIVSKVHLISYGLLTHVIVMQHPIIAYIQYIPSLSIRIVS